MMKKVQAFLTALAATSLAAICGGMLLGTTALMLVAGGERFLQNAGATPPRWGQEHRGVEEVIAAVHAVPVAVWFGGRLFLGAWRVEREMAEGRASTPPSLERARPDASPGRGPSSRSVV